MGIYLNPGNEGFQRAVHSKIYIDKTGLLEYTNSVLDTEQSQHLITLMNLRWCRQICWQNMWDLRKRK